MTTNDANQQSPKHLRERAEKLLAQGLLDRINNEEIEPVVVEFSGSPKSGKTTNIDIVAHFFKRVVFKRVGFKVWTPTEGASRRTPHQLRRDLVAFNAWALSYAVSELLTAYHNVDRHPLIILDRGPFDALAWMRVQKDKNKLSEDDYRRIENFALHPKWMELVSRIYLFTCTPNISLKRENQHKLIEGEGIAMNPDMLAAVKEKYSELRQEMQEGDLQVYASRIVDFDTSKTKEPAQSACQIVKDILDMFDQRINAGQ